MGINKTVTVLIISLIAVSCSAGIVEAEESHWNFDEVEGDVEALYLLLNRTNSLIEASTNQTLSVDLIVVTNEEEVTYNYSSSNLKEALNYSHDALDTVDYSESILKEIQGEVSSYEYLEKLYKPYRRSSQNLTRFSKTHIDFIFNLERSIEVYYEWHDDERDLDDLTEGLDALNQGLYDLKDMRDHIKSAESYIQSVDDEKLDNEVLLGHLSDIKEMLDRYRGYIDDILWLYETLPSYLSIDVPEKTHPGKEITISGTYIESGSFVEGADVEISIENSSQIFTQTDDDGFFSFDYKIPWDIGLGMVNVSVSINDTNISSEINVTKYSSKILLSMDREYYFEESIALDGEFRTDADIPLDKIYLNATFNRSFELQSSGSFSLVYSSENFPWGRSNITVYYQGNETIRESSASISFEVNIPTGLTLESEIMGEVADIEELPIRGELYNATTQEGLEGYDVSLYIDGENYKNYTTDSDGGYQDVLNVSKIAPSDGLYRLETMFSGTIKYRSSVSDPIFIYRKGEVIGIGDDPDEIQEKVEHEYGIGPDDNDDGFFDNDDGFFDNGDDEHGLIPWIPPEEEPAWFIVLAIFVILLVYYFIFYKRRPIEEEEESVEVSEDPKDVSRPVLKKPTVKENGATSRDEIPEIYHEFIEKLKNKGEISLNKGTTHRDIERKVSYKIGSDEVHIVTSIFEKAFFSSKEVTKNEIESFNNGMNRLNKVIG